MTSEVGETNPQVIVQAAQWTGESTRKRRKGDVPFPSKRKRARENKGKMGMLIDMPLDILLEIFALLRPLDLLQLSRITKDMRILLLNRSNGISESIWKVSFAAIDAPGCPIYMSQPTYAALLFEENCNFCSKLVRVHFSWTARVRICMECAESNAYFYAWSLEMTHATTVMRSLTIQHKDGPRVFLWKPDLFAWVGRDVIFMKNLQSKEWCHARQKEMEIMTEHGEMCRVWLQTYEQNQYMERKTFILNRLRNSKWAEEVIMMGDQFEPKVSTYAPLVKAISKEITGHSLSILDKKLDVYMERQYQRRLQSQRKEMMAKGLPILKIVREDIVRELPVNSLYPSTSEVYRLLKQEIDPIFCLAKTNTLTTSIAVDRMDADFKEELTRFMRLKSSSLIDMWRDDIVEKLLGLVKSTMNVPYPHSDPMAVLKLASIFFSCSSCNTSLLRYPDVIMHDCACYFLKYARRRNAAGPKPDRATDETYLKYYISEKFWNASGCIFFEPKTFEALNLAIRLAGLDPAVTTASEIEAVGPIFECHPCHEIHLGRAVLTWNAVPLHVHPSSPQAVNDITPLQLLEGEEAQQARARLKEQQLRDQAKRACMICVHCKKIGNVTQLKLHAMERHDISAPDDKDVVHLASKVQEQPVFYLWPPRLERGTREERKKPKRVGIRVDIRALKYNMDS